MKLRIATWNLDHASNGSRPIPLQIEKIREINPDILVLTETCSKVDLSGLGYFGQASAPNHHKKYCSDVWSKFPIKNAGETYDPVTATCAEVVTPAGSLIVYGTILTYRNDKGPSGDAKAWEEHHKEILRQGEDWKAIQGQFPKVPLVVAGDFNQTRDGSSVYRSLEGIRLLNEQLALNNLECLTDEDFGANGKLHDDPKKGYYRHNIDHICVSKGRFDLSKVGAWDHFTADGELSDHNGVFVDLTF